MNEGNIILHSDGLRFSTYCVCRSSMRDPSDPTPKRQARKRDESACLPPHRCTAAHCVTFRFLLSWAPIGRGEACAHHACDIRRMSLHPFMWRPAGHDLLCDLSLLRERLASSNLAIFLILWNTHRIEKVTWRTGKRAIMLSCS